MKRLVGIAIFCLMAGGQVLAQDCCIKVEAFIGYSYFNAAAKTDRIAPPLTVPPTSPFEGRIGQHGIGFNIAGNFNSKFGIVGDFSYQTSDERIFNHNVDTRTLILLAGPRLSSRNEATTLFAQALIGAARRKADSPLVHASGTDLALSFGAGMDLKIGKHIAFRIFEFDYLPSRGGDNLPNIGKRWSQNFRFQTGFVYRFGN